jgi:hypothetical protein
MLKELCTLSLHIELYFKKCKILAKAYILRKDFDQQSLTSCAMRIIRGDNGINLKYKNHAQIRGWLSLLGFLFDLRPRVFKIHRQIENGFVIRRVLIGAKVPEPFELKTVTRVCLREKWFHISMEDL